jgi:opacity protein-like surface antigen
MMMRRYTWIGMLLLCLVSITVSGQQNFASISFGASLPQGDYAKAGDLSSNGYAKTGGTIKFDGAYFPGSYLGIGGTFGFGSNFAERDTLVRDMVAYIEENSTSIIDIPEDAEIIYGSGFWNYINLFVGPHFSIRAGQRLYFDFRGLAGMTVLRAPEQDLRINFDETEIYSVSNGNKLAFGFTAGGGLRFNLNSDLALKFSADYFQSKAIFTYTFDLFKDVAEEITPLDAEFYVRTVELTIGLAYAF